MAFRDNSAWCTGSRKRGIAARVVVALALYPACTTPDRPEPLKGNLITYEAHDIVRFRGPRGLVHRENSVATAGEFLSGRFSVHYELDFWRSGIPNIAVPPHVTTMSPDLVQQRVEVNGLPAWESTYSGQSVGTRITDVQFRSLEVRGYHPTAFIHVTVVSTGPEYDQLARQVIHSVEVLPKRARP